MKDTVYNQLVKNAKRNFEAKKIKVTPARAAYFARFAMEAAYNEAHNIEIGRYTKPNMRVCKVLGITHQAGSQSIQYLQRKGLITPDAAWLTPLGKEVLENIKKDGNLK